MKRFLGVLILFTFSFHSAEAGLNRFEQVAEGIYRGDQPDTKSDYQILKSLGVRTIINLRTEADLVGKEAEIVDELGMQMVSFPVNALTYPDQSNINLILKTLTDPAMQPVYLHCQYGKDRTGLVIGLYRSNFEGWDRELAWREMVDRGFNRVLVGLGRYFFNHTKPSKLVSVDETRYRE